MRKNDQSKYSNDVEIGNTSPLDMSDNKNTPFSKVEDEKHDHQFMLQDLWTDIAQEEPPTYHGTTKFSGFQPNRSRFQSTQSGCRANVHISCCHYATLVFTTICLGVIIFFYTTAALLRADPLVVISQLHMIPSEQSCVNAKPSVGVSLDIDPYPVITTGSDQNVNLTRITAYKTLTETSTIFSTLLSTVTINTCADVCPANQSRPTVRIATTTFNSPILQVSTVILTPLLQTPSTVTVTSTQSGCVTPTTSVQTTTVVTTEKSSSPTVKQSTRYFTGPNLVGSILNGS